MKERVEVVDFEKELKKRQRKAWVQDKLNKAGDMINRNKELIIMFGPSVIGLVTVGVKTINKQVALRKEANLKDLYCYDRSLGHYWRLRRELTNSEWVEVDKRKSNGERLGDILDEMKVLK